MRQYKILTRNLVILLIAILFPAFLIAQGGIGLLRIANGANLVMTGPVNLVLNDVTFTNDGNFSAGNSQVLFTGIKATLVGGTHASVFNDFIPKKASNNVKLAQHVSVNGNLTMVRGNLNLNNFTVNLGSTGTIINERNGCNILGPTGGSVLVTRSFTPNVAINPGNIGAELLIANSTVTNTIVVERRHAPEILLTGNPGIQRSFTISSPATTSLNYNLRFFYLDGELNANDESLLNLYSVNSIDNSLTLIGRDGSDVSANLVVKNGLAQLGRFTLAGEAGPGGPAEGGGNIINNKAAETEVLPGALTRIKVYPNPVHNDFTIDLFTETPGPVQINLYDQAGHLLQQKKIHCSAGANSIAWDVSGYAAGVYYIAFEKRGVKNIRIIKK